VQAELAQLWNDHARIEASADAIQAELARDNPSTSELSWQLSDISDQVSTHIAVETAILSACDQISLTPAWQTVWRDGKDGFDLLCEDWSIFLHEWTTENIAADIAGFRLAASNVLGRLRERTEAESRTFYLTALQTSVVALK
jgi:hypothetical protein